MVLRRPEVIGLVLTRRSSGSIYSFWAAFSSGVRRGASGSSESASVTLITAVAVGVSIMVRVATTDP